MNGEPLYFDYPAAARAAGISTEQLRLLEQMFRADYPTDDMLYELHVLRACNSVSGGLASLDAILREARDRGASAA